MKLFKFGAVAAVFGAAFTFSGTASATPTPTCSSIYHGQGTAGQANGTTTLPGTDVGTVVAGCQIGDLATNNNSGTGVFISSPSPLASIFQFEWGGGDLLIEEALGNNGTLTGGVDVELGLAAGNSVKSDHALNSTIASINFSLPFVVGGFQTLYSGALASGSYLIDTYSGTITDDPTFQINFITTSASVPEPLTLSLFGAGLIGAVTLRRRKINKA